MTNKEAINYLIMPIATCTRPSAQHLKQKEAYELAIKALEDRPIGEWVEFKGGYYKCDRCGGVERAEKNFCSNCGAKMKCSADMRKGSTEA